MSDFDTPRTTRSGKIRLTKEEIEKIQEEKRQKRQEKLNNPSQFHLVQPLRNPSSEEDSEVPETSDSDDFIPENLTEDETNLSSNLGKFSFTEQQNTSDIQKPSASSTNFSKENKSFDTASPERNSGLDNLDKDPIFKSLRGSLLSNKNNNTRKMSDPPFPTTEFHTIIPEYSGTIKDLQHFISCCDFFHSSLVEAHRGIFLKALVRKLKGKAFNLFNNRQWGDWPEFKLALKKYFSVTKSFETFQLELANIRQGKMPIQEYSQNIEEILHEMNIIGKDIKINNISGEQFFKIQNEKLALKAFLNGLNPSFKNILKARKYESLDDAIRDALELEAEDNLKSSQPQLQFSKFCNYCRRTNHTIEQCFKRKNNSNFNSSNNNFNRSNGNNFDNFQRFGNGNQNNRNGNSNDNSNSYRNSNSNSNRSSNGNSSNNNNNRNFQNYSNQNNNSNNYNNNNRNGGNYRNNGNSSQSNNNSSQSNNNRSNSNQRVRFIENDQKNETVQTAEMDNAALNFILN